MWASIIASLVDKFVAKIWGAISKWWLSKKKIDKAVEKIDKEEKDVEDAVKVIKLKIKLGEELTPDDVKALQMANRKLGRGFYK